MDEELPPHPSLYVFIVSVWCQAQLPISLGSMDNPNVD